MLDNHARLIYFFRVAGSVRSRKRLQKMIYILQKCAYPFKEKFQFHLYGPYSEELTLRIEELCNLHLIEEVKETKGEYCYRMTEDGLAFLKQFSLDIPEMEREVHLLEKQTTRLLELVAVILFFRQLPEDKMKEKLHLVTEKQRYSKEELAKAWQLIERLTQSVTHS